MAWPWKRQRGKKLTSPDGLPVVNFPATWMAATRLYGLSASLGQIYRTQPNIKPVVDFIANAAASVNLKLYEKVPSSPELPDGRLEQPDHPMMLLLGHPNAKFTQFKLWFDTVSDFCVYDVAFWRKVRVSGVVRALQRTPPTALIPQRDPVTRQIISYTDSLGNTVPLDDLVVFHGYDPELYEGSVSLLSTLRRILAEDVAANQHREGMWRNGARREGVIERPIEAPDWSPEAEEAFRADFESIMTGAHNAGRVALLKDGMKWVGDSFNAKEQDWLGGRIATRKECAAALRVDPILVHAADGSITPEIRTAFYVDRLNPLLIQMSQEVDLQLLPEFETLQTIHRVYTEFNLEGSKLRGSFEELARIASSAVGGPYVTVNEIRARVNLPPVPGGDMLFIPLNSIRGGGPQASPQSPIQTPGNQPTDITPGGGVQQASIPILFTPDQYEWLRKQLDAPGFGELQTVEVPAVNVHFHTNGKTAAETPPEDILRTAPKAALRRREEVANRYQTLLNKHLTRQGARIMKLANAMRTKTPGSLDLIWGDQARWDLELSADLQKLTEQVVDENARRAIRQLSRKAKYNPDRTRNFIKKATLTAAISINAKTREDVSQALSDESGDALEAVFSDTGRTAVLGTSFGTSMINFARNEGATQGGGRTKTWIVTSANSRHPEMNGETVSLSEDFSNGLPWPGAWGDVEQSANCQCLVDLG